MHTETRGSEDPGPVLTWIGGPWPLPDGAAEVFGATFHEVVPGGALRCRCGADHDTPPPSDIVVGTPAPGRAALWLGGRPRPIHGVGDPTAAAALAIHVASIAGGGFFGESFEETVALLASTTALELGVFTSESPVEPARAARRWVEARRCTSVLRVLFAGDAPLRAPCHFGRDVLEAHPASSVVQIVPVEAGRWDITIIAAFVGRAAH